MEGICIFFTWSLEYTESSWEMNFEKSILYSIFHAVTLELKYSAKIEKSGEQIDLKSIMLEKVIASLDQLKYRSWLPI